MKSRKSFVICAALCIILTLCLAGCGEKASFSGIKETETFICGEKLNLEEYVRDNLVVKTEKSEKPLKNDNLTFEVTCDEENYDAETGNLDTGIFGTFDVSVDVKSEKKKLGTFAFKVNLEPLEINKGFYVYDDSLSDGFSFLGFCEYINRSSVDIVIKSIEFEYVDKDGITIATEDMMDYAPVYLKGLSTGYASDELSGFDGSLTDTDELALINVKIDYEKAVDPDTTTLEVKESVINRSYAYNESGFAANSIVTNPYKRDVEYYTVVTGMYDADNNFIGAMSLGENPALKANGKVKAETSWLPASREIPDKVKTVKSAARVTSYVGE